MSFKTVKVFLTGHPSVGKTTIVKRILEGYGNANEVDVKGFYTEECRKGGNRIGFDIVYWPNGTCSEEIRATLSRQASSFKKSDPRVGNYKVDIDNVEKYCVSSMVSSNDSNFEKELFIVDEVGKMELLCTAFVPQVNALLDENVENRVILGTIPTPRYGRVIQAVEDIRAREDVIVLHVTKSNRDEIKDVLSKVIQDVFKGKCEFNAAKELFEPYLYMRPIGASSMSGGSKKEVEKTKNKKVSPSEMEQSSRSLPCKPLFGSIPKVLLVGDTASPLPSNVEYSYCERSMWIVLGRMIGIDYKPIKNIDAATNEELKYFVDLKSKIIEKGICIWDVCSDVHEIGEKKSKKRRKMKSTNANDIQNFLGKNPTIDQICFIGKKAKNSFTNYFPEDNKKLKLTVLPSSSPANSRITVDEKAKQWKDAFRISGVTI